MINWLSYMPNKYYDDKLYCRFHINRNTMCHDILNSNKFFYNSINNIKDTILSKDMYIYDCCCNVGSWVIMLSRYVKMCYGVDIIEKYIRIAEYVTLKHNISNCKFFHADFYDINNIDWYHKNIPKIDVLLCINFGFRLFREHNNAIPLVNMIHLIQYYKPRYIIMENMYYYNNNYLCSPLLQKYVNCLSIYNYKKRQHDNKHSLWIFYL